ncbi:chemotaxis protein CheD [Phenylobacterium deserti]|uniref:Probable chemoreceptor glutamine deamidase CheD n=1 Tax=Phenylobacterium deserti TaxID=1914756 RepID=A0A328AQ78_9CAUL|nr:chemotaxis protein CheD [Phenylobacterium deserti]RAK57163.1 chemotaxis protein CheD [Phenylobacterium deserti]
MVGGLQRLDGLRPIHVVQGEQYVTDDPEAVLTTILGSCVSACMRDPLAGVGGMNHFLLPGARPGETDSVRHGVHAMELLVNALLGRGARRERLEVKLFGGARLIKGLTDVGALNAGFAEEFVRREGLQHVGGSLRGDSGRRIQYWPGSGRARQVFLPKQAEELIAIETRTPKPAPAQTGALELF